MPYFVTTFFPGPGRIPEPRAGPDEPERIRRLAGGAAAGVFLAARQSCAAAAAPRTRRAARRQGMSRSCSPPGRVDGRRGGREWLADRQGGRAARRGYCRTGGRGWWEGGGTEREPCISSIPIIRDDRGRGRGAERQICRQASGDARTADSKRTLHDSDIWTGAAQTGLNAAGTNPATGWP